MAGPHCRDASPPAMPPPLKKSRLKKLAKPSKAERAASRSHGGFLLAALGVVAAVAASLW